VQQAISSQILPNDWAYAVKIGSSLQPFAQNTVKKALSCKLCNKLCGFRTCVHRTLAAYAKCLSGILSQTFQARPSAGLFLSGMNAPKKRAGLFLSDVGPALSRAARRIAFSGPRS
jgi:hypothetical protein